MDKEKLRQTACSWQESANSQLDKQNNLYYPLAKLAASLADIDASQLASSIEAQAAYQHLVTLVASFESLFPFEKIGYFSAAKIPGQLEKCFSPVNEMFDPLARILVEAALGESNAELKAKMLNKIGKKVKATDPCCQVECFSSEIGGIVALANVLSLDGIDPALLKILDIYLSFLRNFSQVTNLPPALLTIMGYIPNWVVNLDQKKARMHQRIALLTILKTSHENRAQHNSDHDDKDAPGAGTTTGTLVAELKEAPGTGIPVPAIKEEEEDEEEEFFECEEEEEFFECLPEDELDVVKREREELAEAERLEAEKRAAFERQQELPVIDETEQEYQVAVNLTQDVGLMLDGVRLRLTSLKGKIESREKELKKEKAQLEKFVGTQHQTFADYRTHLETEFKAASRDHKASIGTPAVVDLAVTFAQCKSRFDVATALHETNPNMNKFGARARIRAIDKKLVMLGERKQGLTTAQVTVDELQKNNEGAKSVLTSLTTSKERKSAIQKNILSRLRSLQDNGVLASIFGWCTHYFSRIQKNLGDLMSHLAECQDHPENIDVAKVGQWLFDSVECYQQMQAARDGWLSRVLMRNVAEDYGKKLSGLHASMFTGRVNAVKVRTDMRDALDAHGVHEAARLVASPAA